MACALILWELMNASVPRVTFSITLATFAGTIEKVRAGPRWWMVDAKTIYQSWLYVPSAVAQSG